VGPKETKERKKERKKRMKERNALNSASEFGKPWNSGARRGFGRFSSPCPDNHRPCLAAPAESASHQPVAWACACRCLARACDPCSTLPEAVKLLHCPELSLCGTVPRDTHCCWSLPAVQVIPVPPALACTTGCARCFV
jgi:hypothetical protein